MITELKKQRFLIFNDSIIKAPTTRNERSQVYQHIYDSDDVSITIVKPPNEHSQVVKVGRMINKLNKHDALINVCRKGVPFILTRR